jgi:hypothetical protein
MSLERTNNTRALVLGGVCNCLAVILIPGIEPECQRIPNYVPLLIATKQDLFGPTELDTIGGPELIWAPVQFLPIWHTSPLSSSPTSSSEVLLWVLCDKNDHHIQTVFSPLIQISPRTCREGNWSQTPLLALIASMLVQLVTLGADVVLAAGGMQLVEERGYKLSIRWLGMEQGGRSMHLPVIVSMYDRIHQFYTNWADQAWLWILAH